MEDCCNSIVKYLSFIINFCFFVTGAFLLGVGIYIQVALQDYFNFVNDDNFNTALVLIVLGSAILIIGFFGCCGAITESACCTFMFSTLLGCVVLVEVACCAAVFAFKDDVHSIVNDKMKAGQLNYNVSEAYKGVTATWDAVQIDLKCCGVDDYKSWEKAPAMQETNVPESCCIEVKEGCGDGILNPSSDPSTKIYEKGCLLKVQNIVEENLVFVAGVGVGIILLQLIGVGMSCMLANNMRRRANYV